MVEVKLNTELLKDTDILLEEIKAFMTLNIIHLAQNTESDANKKLNELTEYCNRSFVKLDIFKKPLLNYHERNLKTLKANFSAITTWIYQFLIYAEPILKKYRPDIYNNRFKSLKLQYTSFSKKYLS